MSLSYYTLFSGCHILLFFIPSFLLFWFNGGNFKNRNVTLTMFTIVMHDDFKEKTDMEIAKLIHVLNYLLKKVIIIFFFLQITEGQDASSRYRIPSPFQGEWLELSFSSSTVCSMVCCLVLYCSIFHHYGSSLTNKLAPSRIYCILLNWSYRFIYLEDLDVIYIVFKNLISEVDVTYIWFKNLILKWATVIDGTIYIVLHHNYCSIHQL